MADGKKIHQLAMATLQEATTLPPDLLDKVKAAVEHADTLVIGSDMGELTGVCSRYELHVNHDETNWLGNFSERLLEVVGAAAIDFVGDNEWLIYFQLESAVAN